jgi:WD40 repeat protein
VTVIAYGDDSRAVVAGSEDGKVMAWDVFKKGAKGVELVGADATAAHKGKVTAAFDPKGRYLATAAEDGSVAVWAVDGWKPLKSLSAGAKVTALAWRPDGNMLLAGCGDGKVRTWPTADVTDATARDAPEPKVEALPQGEIVLMVIAPQAHSRYMMFTLDVAGVGVLWDGGWRGERKAIADQGRNNAGAFSPDGNVFVSAGDDRTVYFREMFFPDYVRVKAYGHNQRVRAVAWRPDGKQLASIDEFGDTILWKVGEVPRGLGNPVEVGEK